MPQTVFHNRWSELTDALWSAAGGTTAVPVALQSIQTHHIFSMGGLGSGVGVRAGSCHRHLSVAGLPLRFVLRV